MAEDLKTISVSAGGGEETVRIGELATLEDGLLELLNYHGAEVGSETPGFILADYLLACLAAWNAGVVRREEWYGRRGSGTEAAVVAQAENDIGATEER